MSRPLRILHLTSGSEPGGLSRYVVDLCTAMHEAGHQVAVAGQRGSAHAMFSGKPWRWIDAPLGGGPLSLRRAARILRDELAQHPVDVLHAHYRKSVHAARRLQDAGRPALLYTLHLHPLPLRGPRRWLSDFGDHAIAVSVDGQRWLNQDAGVSADRITVIPHGIDTRRYPVPDRATRQAARAALDLEQRHTAALFVGRLEDPKNADWMLDLAAATRKTLPDLRILLAGDGPMANQLRQRIEREKLQDRVRMLGWLDPLALYHAADALLLPSAREGFSYVCAEAMCAGVPVLRTRTGGASEMIVEGCGRAVNIDHDQFIAAAGEFLANRATLTHMGAKSAELIRARFTFEEQFARTITLYQELRGI